MNGEQEEKQDALPKKGLPVNIIITFILGLCLVGGGLYIWNEDILSQLAGEGGSETARGSAREIGSIYALDSFTVNLADSDGYHYLKVKINLEMNKEKLSLEIKERLPQFRDSIITLLSGKTTEAVKSPEGKAQIKVEIITMLNQYLNTGKITNVYFGDFIVS